MDMHTHGVGRNQGFELKCTVHRPPTETAYLFFSRICLHTILINLTLTNN